MGPKTGIKDVAAEAGVSIATVSRVINGVSTVDPALRHRVEMAIDRLHFVPNVTARSLKIGAGTAIGIIVDSIDDVFFASLVSSIESRAIEHGLGVVVASTGHNPDRERENLVRMRGQGVRGVVLAPVAPIHDYLTPYRVAMPVVAVDRAMPGFDSVTVDDYTAARGAVESLVAGGHRRIGLIGWDPTFSTAKRRRQAYLDVLNEHAIPVDTALVPAMVSDNSDAFRAFTLVLRADPGPTAVFLSNARQAAAVVSAMHRIGRTDLAVVSFGDFLLADAVEPAISCVDQDPYQIGALAFARLLELVADPVSPPRDVVVPTGFLNRASHHIKPSPPPPSKRSRPCPASSPA